MDEFKTEWRKILKQKLVLACFRKDSDEIVGCNFCTAKTIYDEKSSPPKHYPFTAICGPPFVLFDKVNIYKKYDVDKYLGAFGLSVGRKYRGLGISVNILKARYE